MITPRRGQTIKGIRAIQTLREVREVREVATPTGQEARRESYYAFKTLVIKTLREVRRLPNDRRTQPRQILRVPIARTRKRIAADPREDRLRQLTAPRTQPHRPVIKTLRPWFLLPLTVSKRYLPKSSLKQQSAVLSQRDASALVFKSVFGWGRISGGHPIGQSRQSRYSSAVSDPCLHLGERCNRKLGANLGSTEPPMLAEDPWGCRSRVAAALAGSNSIRASTPARARESGPCLDRGPGPRRSRRGRGRRRRASRSCLCPHPP
jgi:hypothetical protein